MLVLNNISGMLIVKLGDLVDIIVGDVCIFIFKMNGKDVVNL